MQSLEGQLTTQVQNGLDEILSESFGKTLRQKPGQVYAVVTILGHSKQNQRS